MKVSCDILFKVQIDTWNLYVYCALGTLLISGFVISCGDILTMCPKKLDFHSWWYWYTTVCLQCYKETLMVWDITYLCIFSFGEKNGWFDFWVSTGNFLRNKGRSNAALDRKDTVTERQSKWLDRESIMKVFKKNKNKCKY